ncbi:MAG TPA: DUF4965 domain-containing protein [Frankiaceae bacterium]|nr:DUF4965 domain-containing protein [Frankiaceae bacterium]
MLADADREFGRAAAFDDRVAADTAAAGGPRYRALCELSLRQAFGGTELVGPAASPWLMLKEISSDGNANTVDVIYPMAPALLYADPELLRLLVEPVLAYAETGRWPKRFAKHDIGASYPNAAGHDDGVEEDMPVEESANMLILAAAYLAAVDAPTPRASPAPTTRCSSSGRTTCCRPASTRRTRTRPTTSPGSSRTASTWRSRASSVSAPWRASPAPPAQATTRVPTPRQPPT